MRRRPRRSGGGTRGRRRVSLLRVQLQMTSLLSPPCRREHPINVESIGPAPPHHLSWVPAPDVLCLKLLIGSSGEAWWSVVPELPRDVGGLRTRLAEGQGRSQSRDYPAGTSMCYTEISFIWLPSQMPAQPVLQKQWNNLPVGCREEQLSIIHLLQNRDRIFTNLPG
uniref:SS18-like protein 2 isoform X1 n=1 Tax=Callithrix jacchus TaxID=9483 RepID=UPI00159F637E|nr:SS18-like protein 2 isoform X1 [Callithrix jacchus]